MPYAEPRAPRIRNHEQGCRESDIVSKLLFVQSLARPRWAYLRGVLLKAAAVLQVIPAVATFGAVTISGAAVVIVELPIVRASSLREAAGAVAPSGSEACRHAWAALCVRDPERRLLRRCCLLET